MLPSIVLFPININMFILNDKMYYESVDNKKMKQKKYFYNDDKTGLK